MSQLRSNSTGVSYFLVYDDDDDDDGIDISDLHVGFGRPKVKIPKDLDKDQEELSDYVIVRLAVARAKAMAKYREVTGEQKG